MVATTRAAPKPLATAISPTAAPSSSVTLRALAADEASMGWAGVVEGTDGSGGDAGGGMGGFVGAGGGGVVGGG